MRNPRFVIETRVRSVGRAFHTEDNITNEGWTVTLDLGNNTFYRLFLPNSLLEQDITRGDKPNEARTITVRTRPALHPGDIVELQLSLPVLNDD